MDPIFGSMLGGAIMPAVSGLLGSVFGGGGDKRARHDANVWNYRQWQMAQSQWQDQMNMRQEDQRREDSTIQRRVADARAAGLHPLFALGAAGGAPSGAAPTTFIPGQAASGSFGGDAIQGVAEGIRSAWEGRTTPHDRRMQDLQEAVLRSQVARNLADAQLQTSRAKSEEVNALSRGVQTYGLGPDMLGPEAVIPEPRRRKVEVHPRQNMPAWTEYTRDDGSVGKIPYVGLNLDETGQLIWWKNELLHQLERENERIRQRMRDAQRKYGSQ